MTHLHIRVPTTNTFLRYAMLRVSTSLKNDKVLKQLLNFFEVLDKAHKTRYYFDPMDGEVQRSIDCQSAPRLATLIKIR